MEMYAYPIRLTVGCHWVPPRLGTQMIPATQQPSISRASIYAHLGRPHGTVTTDGLRSGLTHRSSDSTFTQSNPLRSIGHSTLDPNLSSVFPHFSGQDFLDDRKIPLGIRCNLGMPTLDHLLDFFPFFSECLIGVEERPRIQIPEVH